MLRFLPMETISSLIEGFLLNPHVEVSLSDSKEVLQLRHDLESRNLSAQLINCRDCHKHLCSIWNDSLENTGKSIQK